MDSDILIGLTQSSTLDRLLTCHQLAFSPRMSRIQRQVHGVLGPTLMGRNITNEKLKLTFADLIGSRD
jgi:hypothetical protein